VSLGQLADVNNGAAAQPEWASRSSLSNQAREQRQTVKFDGLLHLQSSVAAVKGAATPGLLDSLAAVKDAAHSSKGGLRSNPFEKQHDDRTLTLPPLNKHSGKGFVISFPSLDNGNGTLVTVPPKEQLAAAWQWGRVCCSARRLPLKQGQAKVAGLLAAAEGQAIQGQALQLQWGQ
jgi:hypothetical protein